MSLQTNDREAAEIAGTARQSELIRRYAPTGLQRSDTIDDALARADSLSGPGSYSGQMLHNKDLRRLVLLAWEYRKLKHQIGA